MKSLFGHWLALNPLIVAIFQILFCLLIGNLLTPCKVLLIVLNILLEFLGLVLVEPRRVMSPLIGIGPLLAYVLVLKEVCDLFVAGIGIRLAIPRRHVLLPVRIDEVIADVLEQFHLAGWPLVQVD